MPLDSSTTDLIGAAAGALTTLAFLPQVVKAWQSRSVRDLSMVTICTLSSGIFLWLVYGLLLGSWPVIAANGTTLVLTLSLLAMKIAWH
ncbi:MAG: SemiSWEET transporter [Vicinamibacterales bacterium]